MRKLACNVPLSPQQVIDLPETPGFRGWKEYFPHDAVFHPAKANLNLLKFLIERYSSKGEKVLDPMAGVYTTCVVASVLGRASAGVELEQKFYDMSGPILENVLDKIDPNINQDIAFFIGDARKLMFESNTFDAIIFSPPYENSMHHSMAARKNWKTPQLYKERVDKYMQGYSEDPDNIGNSKKDNYWREMRKVYIECRRVLKKGKFMVVITKNVVRKQVQQRLDVTTIDVCREVGFTLWERWWRKLNRQSFHQRRYRKQFPDAEHVDYEDVLVFMKK